MKTYLQFGKAGEPMRTVEVPNRERPLYHHIAGLSYTATGYGSKLPTRHMIQYDGRWYRVYSVCYSNVSSEYIITNGCRVGVTLYQEVV